MQDDYLDCYGDAAVIGKIGTDIQDNKCSWLICQALLLGSNAQKETLKSNYGIKKAENEAIVKRIYSELHLKDVFKRYEEESFLRIMGMIDALTNPELPKDMFVQFMQRIFKRLK